MNRINSRTPAALPARLALGLALLALFNPAWAADVPPAVPPVVSPAAAPATAAAPVVTIGSVAARYPAGSVTTVARAGEALAEAKVERALIEARHIEQERQCRPRFFMTACLDQAAEQRRAALAHLRPVEIEAGRTQRLIAAQERDAAIAERLRQEQADLPLHQRNEEEYRAKQAARKAAPPPVVDPQAIARSEAEFAARQAAHEAKLASAAREEAVKQRAEQANIAAYEKRQRDAAEHERDVIKRKADKQAREAKEQENRAREAKELEARARAEQAQQ